jgi:hypothetical protein
MRILLPEKDKDLVQIVAGALLDSQCAAVTG